MAKSLYYLQQARCISQAVLEGLRPISSSQLIWRSNEDDPRKHNRSHEGLFYLLPPADERSKIFGCQTPYHPNISRYYQTIGMMPLMIREPSLKAKDYIEKRKPNSENLRILFYGDEGRGKTHILTHLIHYIHSRQDSFIVHIRDIKKFTRSPRGYKESTTRPRRWDTPADALSFLNAFRNQNADLIELYRDKLTCKKDYSWSLRETTKQGESIFKILDQGLGRVNHASDCAAVLFKELSGYADEGAINLVSVIDDVRYLFDRHCCRLHTADNKKILVDEMTFARSLKKLIKGNYRNGVVLAACHDETSSKQNQSPQDIIGLEGWQYFDPFIPMNVPSYTRKEFESCMNMYQDIGWLTRPVSRTVEGRDEVRFVSGLNPGQVHRLCEAI